MQAEEWNELLRRWEERDRRWQEQHAASEKRWEEQRAESERRWEERSAQTERLMRELTERHVAVTQELIGAVGSLETTLTSAIEDMRDQVRANTEAILRLLDRFGEGPVTA